MVKKVLLCDDEVLIVRVTEVTLARSGYAVRFAYDGQEAWQMILHDRPDILVTDVHMPRVDGLGLTRRVRDNPKTKDLPIILFSAKSFEPSSEELLEKWRISDLLAKPFSPRELIRLVDRAVRAPLRAEDANTLAP